MDINKFKDIIVIDHIAEPNTLAFPDDSFKWSLNKLYDDELDNLSVEFSKKDYIPKSGDKLYFYPHCTVPRYKVRNWANKLDLSVTIKEEYADAKFGSEESLTKCINSTFTRKAHKDKFVTWLLANYKHDRHDIINLIEAIEKYQGKYVYLHNGYQGYWGSTYLGTYLTANGRQRCINQGFKTTLVDLDPSVDDDSEWMTMVTDYKTLESLLTESDIYSQEKIIALINEDSITIDQDMYKRLDGMLVSTNNADKVMAIEIIANCNIDPSLHHVLLLMKKHYDVILNMKESNHVNFKSLLEYIGITRRKMTNITDDDMITYLMDKDVLTYNTVKELSEGVKDQWKNVYDSKHFKIQTVTVSDEVKNYFKKKQQQINNS